MQATPRVTVHSDPNITPFWQRVPRFFVFPFQPMALIRILGLSALASLGMLTGGIPSMIMTSLLLSLVTWIFFLRFACRVLSETSLGRLSLSDYPEDEEDESLGGMPFKIVGLFIIPGFVVGIVATLFGNGVGFVANAVVSLATPAALMVLVTTRSLSSGLTPGASWAVMTAMGRPYLLLCVFLYFLSSAEMLLISKVVQYALVPLMERFAELNQQMQELNPMNDAREMRDLSISFQQYFARARPRLFGAMLLMQAVAMHFTLIGFNMLGYALFQYHSALGLDIDEAAANPAATRKPPEDPASEEIAALLAEGKVDRALDIAYEAQRIAPDDATAQERYHKLLHLAGKDDRLLNHSHRLIPLLLTRGQNAAALAAWQRCRERHPDFRLSDAEAVLKLAEAARSAREPRQALDLLNGFDRHFRNHALIPEVYFLCGSLLCEELRKDEMADRFLATLITRYPDHPRTADALRLREVIARMRKQTPGSAS